MLSLTYLQKPDRYIPEVTWNSTETPTLEFND